MAHERNQNPRRVNIQLKEDNMRKAILLLCVATGLLLLPAAQVLAFHDGGVAACTRCHTMHNSENGQLIDPNSPDGNDYLLKDATASDVCLSCHATGHGSQWSGNLTAPSFCPGGDFTLLTEDNINDGRNGHLNPIVGSYAGHNINAPSKNSPVDPVLDHAPGGTYPSSALGCSSCHDPHGNQGFRMLYGIGHVQAGNATFVNPAPDAIGASTSNPESNTNHTGYHSGMSAWCANCHGDYHNNSTQMVHPSGVALGADIAQAYNLYAGTDNPTGGSQATAYIAVVPFEDPANTTTSTTGPSSTSKVSCVTCHRAHASTGPNIGRWDFALTFLADDGIESGSFALPNPYTVNQRSLCNKCHVKDAGDEPR